MRGSVAPALGGEALGEPPPVGAVVVAHAVPLGPGHGELVVVVRHPVHPIVAAPPVALAPVDAGVLRVRAVGGEEGRLGPVDLDGAVARGPEAAVPEGGVHLHGPGVRVGQVVVAPERAHRDVVHLEEDVPPVPGDGVAVEVRGRVEPQVELPLLLPVPARPHVGVEHHRVPRRVAHELHVDLVVVRAVPRTGGQLVDSVSWSSSVQNRRILIIFRSEGRNW
jgi:hypothetical protein